MILSGTHVHTHTLSEIATQTTSRAVCGGHPNTVGVECAFFADVAPESGARNLGNSESVQRLQL